MSYRQRLEEKLTAAFSPVVLDITDESARHAGHMAAGRGHAPHDGAGETHFTVRIVSAAFDGQSRLNRQRMVHDCVKDELRERIHALSLKTETPAEAGLA